jgi:hypothetical protein
MRNWLKGLAALPLAAAFVTAGEPIVIAPVPHGAPVPHAAPACPCTPKKKTEAPTVTVKAVIDEDNGCEIKLGCRKGLVTPCKSNCSHTGGGNIDVQQPDNDTLVITMTGAAVAFAKGNAGFSFDLNQAFKIECAECEHKKLKLEVEGRLIGLLRSHCKGGSAEVSNACATITADGPVGSAVATLAMPGHSAAGGENLSVNDKEGPVCVPVCCGCYTLHASLNLSATGAGLLSKAPSVEFAEGAIDPLWISSKEPFFGAAKKDFGFQITVKLIVEDCPEPENGKPENGKEVEKVPGPKPMPPINGDK